MEVKLANKDICTGCGLCAGVCPKHAIALDYDRNGFLMPIVNEDKCIKCGLCEKYCKNILSQPRASMLDIIPYMGWSRNEEVRINSASGGVFSQIAYDFLINNNSIVVGASSIANNKVEHVIVSNPKDLKYLQGSKYNQSDCSRIWKDLKKYSKQGYKILFSGTPCQVAACKTLLPGYENLFTVEVVCHGVPSRYTSIMETKYYQAESLLSYRNKKNGWYHPSAGCSSQSCTLRKGDGTSFSIPHKKDIFWKAFPLTQRYSCYQCNYKLINRCADISLADYWGVKNLNSEDYQKGVSLILASTLRGHSLLCSENLYTMRLTWESCLGSSKAIYICDKEHLFFSNYLWLINKLPIKIGVWIITFQWKKLWFLIPLKLKQLKIKKRNSLRNKYEKQELLKFLSK